MKKIQQFKSFVTYLSAPISAFFGKVASEHLNALSLPTQYQLGVAVIVVIVVFWGLRNLGDLLLKSQKIRRLILGSQYIEGTWLDAVTADGKLIYIGVLRISVSGDGELRITGENVAGNGVPESTFFSELVSMRWPVLRLQFARDRAVEGNPETIGFSRLSFAERSGPPTRYKGYYVDAAGKRGDYTGWKVDCENLLCKLDDPHELAKIVKRLSAGEISSPSVLAEILES